MPLTYPLDLDDGRPPIMCRDAHQAELLRGLWRAWHYQGPPILELWRRRLRDPAQGTFTQFPQRLTETAKSNSETVITAGVSPKKFAMMSSAPRTFRSRDQ